MPDPSTKRTIVLFMGGNLGNQLHDHRNKTQKSWYQNMYSILEPLCYFPFTVNSYQDATCAMSMEESSGRENNFYELYHKESEATPLENHMVRKKLLSTPCQRFPYWNQWHRQSIASVPRNINDPSNYTWIARSWRICWPWKRNG